MKGSSIRMINDELLEIVFYIGGEFYYKAVAFKILEIGNESFALKYMHFHCPDKFSFITL